MDKVYDWKRKINETCLGNSKFYQPHEFINNIKVDGVEYKGCTECGLLIPMIIYNDYMERQHPDWTTVWHNGYKVIGYGGLIQTAEYFEDSETVILRFGIKPNGVKTRKRNGS